MDAPLGRNVGNALEVVESIETLKGNGPKDLTDLSVLLAARMVKLAGLAADDAEAEKKVRRALDSGAGLEVFRRCVEEQGGDPRVIDDYTRLPTAPRTMAVVAPRPGFVSEMTAGAVGVAGMVLGAGRERAEDGIDHAVGVVCRAKPGDPVRAGEVVYEVRYRSTTRMLAAVPLLEESFRIADAPPPEQPLVLDEIV
jgi:thymidine phosphorylase